MAWRFYAEASFTNFKLLNLHTRDGKFGWSIIMGDPKLKVVEGIELTWVGD